MTDQGVQRPAIASASSPLRGRVRVPGDLRIGRRAILLAGVASGRSRITGIADHDDLRHALAMSSAFGAKVTAGAIGEWQIDGVGNGCLLEPGAPIAPASVDTAALATGLAAGYDMETRLAGGTWSGRSLTGIFESLRLMGAQITASEVDLPVLAVRGPRMAAPISYRVPEPCQWTKSAVLLAGLNAPGETAVAETSPTHDHTERMLRWLGVQIETVTDRDAVTHTRMQGQADIRGKAMAIPGDPSLAAFVMVAALVVPGSEVIIENVLVNPTRMGLVSTLLEMGGSIEVGHRRMAGGEDVADLRVRGSELKGVAVPAGRFRSMCDDVAALAVAAAFAEGTTRLEFTHDQASGIDQFGSALRANNVEFRRDATSLSIVGVPDGVGLGGGHLEASADPAIAMAALVMGLAANRAVIVSDPSVIAAVFPAFVAALQGLGADIVEFEGSQP